MKENFSILVNNPLDCEYIQRLSFKAGYAWEHGGEQTVKYKEATGQLFFRDKKITRGDNGRLTNPERNPDETLYSFPKDAVAIYELFNTPEYKVGDYVVMVDELESRWTMNTFFKRVEGSVREITAISRQGVSFKKIEHWNFPLNAIYRLATQPEIDKYSEGDDIYIGEHKVEFLGNGAIKVGCIDFPKPVLEALSCLADYSVVHEVEITINKKEISFVQEPGNTIVVSEEVVGKILKKAGI